MAKDETKYKFERRSSGGNANAPEYMANFFRKKTAELASTKKDKKSKNRTSRFLRPSQRRVPEKSFSLQDDLALSDARSKKSAKKGFAKKLSSLYEWSGKKMFDVGRVKVTRLSFAVCLIISTGIISGGVALASSAGPIAVMNIFESKKHVSIQYGSVAGDIETNADTVQELLDEQGVTLGEYDEVVPGLDSRIEEGMVIDINRAFEVIITSAVGEQTLYLTGGTVTDALEKARVRYDSDDMIEPGLDTELSQGMHIVHTAVAYTTIYERADIEYEEVHEKNDTIEEGYFAIEQEGQNGVLLKTIKVCYINGEEASREVLSEEVEVEPVTKIVLDGTAPQKHTHEEADQPVTNPGIPGGPSTYEEEMICSDVTAYSGDGITATGTVPRYSRTRENPGTCAVDPDTIPYGSLLYVPGYGYCIAEDTGGFRDKRPNQIDLFMETEAECRSWGRKHDYKIYIVKWG